jgi:predicted Zn-dependent protease
MTLVVARIHSNTIAGTGAPEMPDELLMHQVLKQGTESCETADLKTEEHIMMPGRVIPVREMLGELLLELKQPAMALVAFEQSQKNDPNRFRNVYGAAHAAELAGDRKKASAFYAQLLAQVGAAAGRSEIEHARSFTAKH